MLSSSNLGCMKVGKASRAQWHTALHADVFGLPRACSIVASVCIFHLGELGPVISCAKPDLAGYFGDCSALHRRWGPTGSSSSALLEGASIYQCTSYRSFEEEELHLFQSRHQVEAPGIYNGHIQKMKKHSDVPSLVPTSVGIHCHTLVYKIDPTHVLIVKGHREGFLDPDHRFFLLDPSVGNIFRGLASTRRGHVDD